MSNADVSVPASPMTPLVAAAKSILRTPYLRYCDWREFRRTQSPTGYRDYLRGKFGGPRDIPFRPFRENDVLRTDRQCQEALSELAALGLPPYLKPPPKSWDSLIALKVLRARTRPGDRILDAGAEFYSMILPWLYMYGYDDLVACNLVFDKPEKRGTIQYEYGDITKTAYGDQSFDAITCLSVIEHGVPLEPFLAEMARLLKPGAPLVVSTDYFESPIDTHDKVAFGVPVRIFNRDDIVSFVGAAERAGLHLSSPLELESQDRIVQWNGLEYTFICLSFTKR